MNMKILFFVLGLLILYTLIIYGPLFAIILGVLTMGMLGRDDDMMSARDEYTESDKK